VNESDVETSPLGVIARFDTVGGLFAGRLSVILVDEVLQASPPVFPLPFAAKPAILRVAVPAPELVGVTQSNDHEVEPELVCVALEPLIDVPVPALAKEPLSMVAEKPPEPELERLTVTV
tara:strand:+ start:23 stop:382 length:360 start_codon:yes stop_codon:yes gene_type:complete